MSDDLGDNAVDGLTDRLMRTTEEGALVQLLNEFRRFMTNEELVRMMLLRERRLVRRTRGEAEADMLRKGYRIGRYGCTWADWWRLTLALLKKL